MPRRLRLILLLAIALPGSAYAEVRHCIAADGSDVYTDRRCDEIGGRAFVPSQTGATPQLRTFRTACPRTLRDLAWEVSSAVGARDVNRLASVYLWAGIGTRQGYALMDRLQRVVDRPLVDLQPVWTGGDDYGPPDPPRPPVGLRLDQTSTRGSTPIRTVFGLRRHLDCWWIVEGGTPRPRTSAPDTVEDVPTPAD